MKTIEQTLSDCLDHLTVTEKAAGIAFCFISMADILANVFHNTYWRDSKDYAFAKSIIEGETK